ncbi:unnamed protein product, partial [Chrysoparadoxa australica]
ERKLPSLRTRYLWLPAMSDILLRWVNEELSLSQNVLNLDHDFRSGYLLGEILHLHNQQQDFDQFGNSPSSEDRVNNFCRLEPTLRSLKVPFDAQRAHGIISGKSGAVSVVLYQLKMSLDRLRKFSTPVSLRPSQVAPLPNMPHRPAKPQFDRCVCE